jgi:hypothetical protein
VDLGGTELVADGLHPRPPLDPLTSTQPRMIMRLPPYLRDRHAEDHDLRLEY